MQLPDVLTEDSVIDMVKRMKESRERLHLGSFKRLRKKAIHHLLFLEMQTLRKESWPSLDDIVNEVTPTLAEFSI